MPYAILCAVNFRWGFASVSENTNLRRWWSAWNSVTFAWLSPIIGIMHNCLSHVDGPFEPHEARLSRPSTSHAYVFPATSFMYPHRAQAILGLTMTFDPNLTQSASLHPDTGLWNRTRQATRTHSLLGGRYELIKIKNIRRPPFKPICRLPQIISVPQQHLHYDATTEQAATELFLFFHSVRMLVDTGSLFLLLCYWL